MRLPNLIGWAVFLLLLYWFVVAVWSAVTY